jgi:hypothetical protein
MYVSFKEMPQDARLWIYQADRRFAPAEKAAIESSLVHLCETWQAHGTPIRASFCMEHDIFLILAVDERAAGASGCSIDGTVRLLKDLQHRLGLDFFNRQMAAILEGQTVRLFPVNQLKTLFESGVLTGESTTFNNAMVTKGDWERGWRIPARESWLTRFLPKPAGARRTS